MLHSVQSMALRKLVDTNTNAWLSICARFRQGVPANSSNSGSSTHHAADVMTDVAMSYANADISSGSGSSAVVAFNAEGTQRDESTCAAAADAILNSSVEDNAPDFPGNADDEASKQASKRRVVSDDEDADDQDTTQNAMVKTLWHSNTMAKDTEAKYIVFWTRSPIQYPGGSNDLVFITCKSVYSLSHDSPAVF
jgi:hypothetical protein